MLQSPTRTGPSRIPAPGRTRYFKAIAERGNRVLRVVVEGHLVVTAHFDRDARNRRPSHVQDNL